MTTMMRCTESQWLGNEFVAKGTLLPKGHPLINEHFEEYEIPGSEPKKPVRGRAK